MKKIFPSIDKVNALLGVLSSLCFLFGSLLFLPNFAEYSVTGVWLFAMGSALMLVTTMQQAFAIGEVQ
jgi:hypothetical protein